MDDNLLFLNGEYLAMRRTANGVVCPSFLIEVLISEKSILADDAHVHHLFCWESRRLDFHISRNKDKALVWDWTSSIDKAIHFELSKDTT